MKPEIVSSRNWIWYNMLFVFQHFLGAKRFSQFFGSSYWRLNETIKRQNSVSLGKHDYMNDQPLPGYNPQPAVFRGVTSAWSSHNKWNFDFFSQVYGKEEVILNDNPGIIDPDNPQSFEKLRLKDYISQLQQGSLKYLKLSNLAQKNPELQKDLDISWLQKFKRKGSFGETFYMFMGGKGSITPMHNELPATLYIQVYGRKRWVIYPPEDRIFLNARTERRPYYFSEAIPGKPNAEKAPLQYLANPVEVILEPGDAIWVPPFVWHYVENLSDSIGIAYKYAHLLSAVRSSKLLTLLFFFTTRPSIIYSFFVSRIKKDDYVLMKRTKE